MFPQSRPFPQLLISPAQSEEQDTAQEEDSETITPGLVTETDSNIVINNNNVDISLDEGFLATDSCEQYRQYTEYTNNNLSGDERHWHTDGSSRKSSMSSFSVNIPHAKSMKVPSFDSKMAKLSPIPLALTPQSQSGRHRGSALSVMSSISSRSETTEARLMSLSYFHLFTVRWLAMFPPYLDPKRSKF